MKKSLSTLTLAASVLAHTPAFAATSYDITITNGSGMPISPALVYAAPAQSGVRAGVAATPGFVGVCQSGNVAARAMELQTQGEATSIQTTTGPILPGESRTVTIDVKDPLNQALHIESMYGKSKDTCGIATVGSHSLVALKKHVTAVSVERDFAISTGHFLAPAVDGDYLSTTSCQKSVSAVECLRELALPATPVGKVAAFSGYLPSVLKLIEEKFGSKETQSLLIPASGGITVETKLNH